MIKNEPYYYDETQATVEDASDWIEAKHITINRDPFNYNFCKLIFDMALKCPMDKSGEVAIFIDDEETPRLVAEYDLPFYTTVHKEIDTYDLQWGRHKITLCLKGNITNKDLKISVLRFWTLPEIVGNLTPTLILTGALT